jgi:hypothetical protein
MVSSSFSSAWPRAAVSLCARPGFAGPWCSSQSQSLPLGVCFGCVLKAAGRGVSAGGPGLPERPGCGWRPRPFPLAPIRHESASQRGTPTQSNPWSSIEPWLLRRRPLFSEGPLRFDNSFICRGLYLWIELPADPRNRIHPISS